MLIAHVLTRLLKAGSEENTLSTCAMQVREGHEVVLIHGQEFDPTLFQQWNNQFQLIRLDSLVRRVDPVQDVLALQDLRWTFRRLQPEVVHTHQSKAGVLGRIAARLESIPTIIHGVHILPFLNVGWAQRAIYLTAERSISAFTDAYIDVSQGMRLACLEHKVGAPSQHYVVHSGFDVVRFRTARRPPNWRALLGIAPDEPVPPIVVMLAAFEPRKRHMEFLSVFRTVVDRIPQIRLLLAGDGGQRLAVEAEIARLGLAHNVKVLGYHPNPEQLIALSDVCILSSQREGLPRAVVQYIAGGKPAIVSGIPGIEEVVHDGVNGLVAPGDDLQALADSLAEVLIDRRLRDHLRRGAAQSDVSSWSVTTMGSNISQIYEQLEVPTPDREPRASSFKAADPVSVVHLIAAAPQNAMEN